MTEFNDRPALIRCNECKNWVNQVHYYKDQQGFCDECIDVKELIGKLEQEG